MTKLSSPLAALALAASLAPLTLSAQLLPPPTPPLTLPAPTPSATSAPLPVGAPLKPPTSEVARNRRLVRSVEENTENVQAKGKFGAQLWLVEGRTFFEDWKKPETPSIAPVDVVLRGHTIYTAVIFYGMAKDQSGLSKVTYNITVKRPDGSVYEQRNDAIGWQNLPPSDEKQLLLGRDALGITVSLDDPAGLYTVEVLVRDAVTRVELPLKSHFVIQ